MYAICPYSVVPVRNGAAHSSEMQSQLLFGETVEILETKGKQWRRVRCTHDNHIGWVAFNQLQNITEVEFLHIQTNYSFNLELLQPAIAQGHYLPLTMGARLPDFDGLRFQLLNQYYTFSGQAIQVKQLHFQAELFIKIARRYLYAPYLWGGRSPLGIDAAGLAQMIYAISGKSLPRDPLAQLEYGEIIDFVEQTQVGDLAFFENRAGRITHVGILLENQEIIHAHGCVRLDQLDHFGIYNRDTRRYTHRLRVIKRLFKYDKMTIRKEKKEDAKDNLQQIGLF
ncbi:MAG: NlpC/P60 family protein [Saprospiraceae bacterium]